METNKPVVTIILIVISLVLVFLFVIPQYQASKGLETTLAEKQAEYDGRSAYHAKINEVLRQLASRKDVLEKVDNALPADFTIAPLVNFFQSKGLENGLTVKSVVFSQIQPVVSETMVASMSKEIKQIAFTINISGSYRGLKDFLASLETSARILQITSLSLKSPEAAAQTALVQKNQSPVYDFTLQVQTQVYQ